MKKVILYGIRGIGRKEIETYLSDEFEIIGYSDSAEEYQNYKYFDYKKFYTIDKLKILEFDYCIITPIKKTTALEIKNLLMGVMQQNKIIVYALFREVQFPHPYEIYEKIYKEIAFAGYILGMSHAYRGIDVNLFHEPIFNFGFSSNDLFFHYNLLNKIFVEKKFCVESFPKWCILELPYYIFNWDRSRSNSATRCINAYTMLEKGKNQYHHIAKDGVIEQYQVYESMFKGKKTINSSSTHIGVYEIENRVWQNTDMEISGIWKMQHEDTIKENIGYLNNILRLLYSINNKIKIIVVIFPQNPDFYNKHSDIIERTKNIFYQIINSVFYNKFEIWDYFRFYESKSNYFEDDCHLNLIGRNEFTKELVRRLEKTTK